MFGIFFFIMKVFLVYRYWDNKCWNNYLSRVWEKIRVILKSGYLVRGKKFNLESGGN